MKRRYRVPPVLAVEVYFGRLGARVDAVDHLVFDNFLTSRDEHDVHITGGAFVRF